MPPTKTPKKKRYNMSSPAEEFYGLEEYFEPGVRQYQVEMFGYVNSKHSYPKGDKGLGKAGHFWKLVDIIWNHEDDLVFKSEWGEQMIEESIDNEYTAIGGCASSTKSCTLALFGIMEWLSHPADTQVLMTSTSLKAAKKRIWGAVEKLWYDAPGMPGKYKKSEGQIVYMDDKGQTHDTAGISLIACEKSQEQRAIGKFIGIKAERVIVIADELSEIPESILAAYEENLNSNPYSKFIGISNPMSRFDAFGNLSQPKDGWNSVTEADYEWETTRGKFIRFDAELSPNVKAGKEVFPRMPTLELVESKKKLLGEKSAGYYRMIKGWFPPTGSDQTIYQEYDMIVSDAMAKVIWKNPPTKYAGLDPAFTSGGDRPCVVVLAHGEDKDGNEVIQVDDIHSIEIDATDETPESYQVARQFRDYCNGRGIPPGRVAFDATGAGITFGDILSAEWSPAVTGIHFSSAPSDNPVSNYDETLCSEIYKNKNVELWFSAKDPIKEGKVKGITQELAKEMLGRHYFEKNHKIQLESKKEYKTRLKKSPDIADSFFVCFDLVKDQSSFGEVVGHNKGNINMDEYSEISFNINSDIYGDADLTW